MTESKTITVNEQLAAAHGLNVEEYNRIIRLIGRTPTFTELGIFSAMWNEHCSYKSSKKWLRTLPTDGPQVIQGPGENAGVVDIGDGDCVVFKMESHNHPSYIEPYQGAATGVGGILRDVFTMGARPVAAMNALRFGAPEHPRTRHLVSGVVAGVGGYANSFGVPTVGGEVEFDACYNGNILVNAFAAGIAKSDQIFYSKPAGVGLPVVYLGAKTGRDGVGGATMASAEFDQTVEEKRPTVQVGDPFTEKCLLEACMELMASGAVIAIQDMGAAGLTCSAVEMGAKGNLGIELNLDQVPVRESNMSAYEMMLSESQERMLMVLKPELREQAQAIFAKWGLDFAQIGQTTDDLRFRILYHGSEVANLPIKELGDEAPEYDRPWIEPVKQRLLTPNDVASVDDLKAALLTMIGSANLSSRRWVYEQYDTFIQGNTIMRPGADAGIVRIESGNGKALAFSSDVTPRYCQADPFEGGKQAVAECWRNLTVVGARPLACSDNLNFGNPERPEIMGQLVAAIRGIGQACKYLGFPVVSGNVSLYNETNGVPIFPTPTIAGVGLIDDLTKIASIDGMQEGDTLFLIGADGEHLGQSMYQHIVLQSPTGAPPPINLVEEKKNGDFVRMLINMSLLHATHDISDGGLAVALAEMVIKSGRGADINLSENSPLHALLFGEDQSRYIVASAPQTSEQVVKLAERDNIQLKKLGNVLGNELIISNSIVLTIDELKNHYENWFPDYMNSK